MHTTSARSLAVLALAFPAFAQEPAPKTAPPVTEGPALVLESAEPPLVSMLAMRFGHMEELPLLASGSHYIMSLGADQKVKVASAPGDVGLLRLKCNPGALMTMFAEQINSVKPMVRGTMTVALQAQGMKPKDVAELVDSWFAFPNQMAQFRLHVVGDPQNPTEKGIDVTLSMDPIPNGGFARFLDAMQPCSQGVPSLPHAGPMMDMQLSLAPEGLRAILEPMRGWILGLTFQDPEAKKQAAAVWDQWFAIYDGGVSMALGPKMEGHMLVGALDATKLQQLMASDEYLSMMKNQQMANNDIEMEITPNALEYKGVKVHKTKVTMDNPMMPEGSIESFSGSVGNMGFVSVGGKDAAAKATIDAIADKKVQRAPIPGGAVARMTVNLRSVVALVQDQMQRQGPDPDSIPEKMTMSLGRDGKSLRVHVFVK